MEAPIALNVTPMNTLHKDLNYLPLVDKDFKIKDQSGDMNHLQTFCQIRDNHLRNSDIFGLWESNLPMYFLLSVHVFLDIIHQCCASYDPVHRAGLSPSQIVPFSITAKSINEMIHFHSTEPLSRLSMGFLLEKASQLPNSEITRIAQMFMKPNYQPQGPPPYLHTSFTETGKLILDMISLILGFKSSEYVDDITLVLLSIFTLGQLPAVKYDYATFIANKIHDQLLNLDREGVFKYTSYIYHLLLYYQPDNFPFAIRKLDSKGNQRSVIFWSSVFHNCDSPYTYSEFIDLFVHPASTLLIGAPPPRITGDMKNFAAFQTIQDR